MTTPTMRDMLQILAEADKPARPATVQGKAIMVGSQKVGRIEKVTIMPGFVIRFGTQHIYDQNADGSPRPFKDMAAVAAYVAANQGLFLRAPPDPPLPDLDPHSIWGFWIDADGEVIHVRDHREEASHSFSGAVNATDDAFNAGWIRVLCPVHQKIQEPEFRADWWKTTPAARRALARLIKALPDYAAYDINGQSFLLQGKALQAIPK